MADKRLQLIRAITKKVNDLEEYELEELKEYVDDNFNALSSKKSDALIPGKLNIGIDFDGVLHDYKGDWKGYAVITEKPVEGAIEWLTKVAQDSKFVVYVLSSRSKDPDFEKAMKTWLTEYGFDKSLLDVIHVTPTKPPLHIYIDDRVYFFQGKFPKLEYLENFKSWSENDSSEKVKN